MKKLALLIIATMAFPFLVKGQTPTENYTTSTVLQEEYTWAQITNGDAVLDHMLETVTYYDGLGRPIQTVAQRAGGDRENLVTPVAYDPIGRKPLDYLPLPVALDGTNESGELYDPVGSAIHDELQVYYKNKFPDDFYPTNGAGYIPDWDNPFSEKILEDSPLSRVLEQGAPGFDWHAVYNDHTIQFGYQTNGTDEVHHFSVDYDNQGTTDYTDPELEYEGFYPQHELFKNVTKDENWTATSGNDHTIQEFTNKQGQMVLKRAFNGTETLDTYYVYDDDGNLTYVLSPEASDKMIIAGNLNPNWQTVMDDLGYQYKYDHRGRIFEKKIPGKGSESIIYDVLDRPVLTQDAEMLKNNEWLFTKYDVLGRVAYTGMLSNHTKSQVQSGLSGLPLYEERELSPTNINGTQVYYSNDAFPQNDIEVHTVNYYDTYVDTGTLGTPPPTNSLGTDISSDLQGLPTVSKVRVLSGLDKPTPDQIWITTVSGYDEKARPIYVHTENDYLSSEDLVESLLDFTGKPTETVSTHDKDSNATITVRDYFTYDHLGRLKTHRQRVNDEEVELIASNTYDALGQLVQKGVGGTSILEGYTDLTEVEISPEGVIASTNTQGTNPPFAAYIKTKGEIPPEYDGGVDFKPLQTDLEVRGGLVSSNNANLPDGYFDYGFHLVDEGTPVSPDPKIYLVIEGTTHTGTSYGDYDPGDIFRVMRVGDDIQFWHKNAILTTVNATNPGDIEGMVLVGKVNFNGPAGAEVDDLRLFSSATNTRLQNVDYTYNVRGWLTDINDVEYQAGGGLGGPQLNAYNDLFHFRINYNNVEGTGSAIPLYNGNIAQTFWKSDHTDKQLRGYSYVYDPLNRFLEAKGQKGNNLSSMSAYNTHDVDNISYDLNGNLLTLDRMGTNVNHDPAGDWDLLSYTYEGNRLTNVADASQHAFADFGFKDGNDVNASLNNDYDYDDNGNLIKDLNKHVQTTSYNHLDLPTYVSMDDQQGSSGTLLYVYDAVGTKLEKTFTDGGINPTTVVTQYAAGYVYQKYGTDPNDLQFFPHPEGYVEPTSASSGGNEKSIGKFNAGTGQTTQTGFRYVYQYRDHLGNVRLSYVDSDGNGSINPSGEIIEESHYYPFGLKQNGYNNNISSDANLVAQKWKYNGVELNEDLSLNLYEMEMRSYDPAIGRFLGIDPVTHHSQGTSVAFDNNPIFWADPSGADAAAPNSTVAANKGLPKEIQMAQNFGMGEHITHGAQLGNNSVPRDGGAAINTELSNAMHYPRVFSEMRANHNPDDYLISNGSNDNGDWEPLTKRVLVDYVSQYCTGCSKEALNSMAGQLFEQAFSDFALLNNLFLGYRPSPDKSESTIPDGYSDVTSYTNVGPVIYSGHNFIEVKTKNVTPDAQIRGFINELAIMGKVSGLPSNIPVSITFVTLADNYVTKGVYNYANKTLGKNGYGVFKTSKVDHWQPRYRMSQGSMEIDFGRRTILNFGRPLYNSNSIKVRL